MLEDVAADVGMVDALQRRLVVLRQHLLTRLRADELPEDGEVALIACRMGSALVALPLDSVEMLIMRCALAPIPGSATAVIGLLDYRGDPLPVLDLQRTVLGKTSPLVLTDVFVICRSAGRRGALLVQGVVDLWQAEAIDVRDEIHDVPHAPCVMGTARHAGGTAVVLSVATLLDVIGASPLEVEP